MQAIELRVANYSEALAPIRDAARRYLRFPGAVNDDGVLLIGHRPWVAPQNYTLVLFPGIDRDSQIQYDRAFGITTPGLYADFLREIGEAICFGMFLCGVPKSMLLTPPLLQRSLFECHDLAIAVTLWGRDLYLSKGLFQFGYRYLSELSVAKLIDVKSAIPEQDR